MKKLSLQRRLALTVRRQQKYVYIGANTPNPRMYSSVYAFRDPCKSRMHNSNVAANAHTSFSPQEPGYSRGTIILTGVKLTVTEIVIQGAKVTQLAALKGGKAVAVFNLTTTTAEKSQLLHNIAVTAQNPAAQFDLTWTAISPTSGTLTIKLQAIYTAAANKPSVSSLW